MKWSIYLTLTLAIIVAPLLLLQQACVDDQEWVESVNSRISGPLQILTVGANRGNHATETWVGQDWSSTFANSHEGSTITHASVDEFNAMTAETLLAYDVVLTQWATSGTLDLASSAVQDYVAGGGGLILDGDYNNFNDLAWAGITGATSSCAGSGSNWEMNTSEVEDGDLLSAGLPSNPDLENCHGSFPNYDATNFVSFLSDLSGNTSGLAGHYGNGRIIITGPDQDYHSDPVNHPEQFQLLLNEITWVSEHQGNCTGDDCILGVPVEEFNTAFQSVSCENGQGFSRESTDYAIQLYHDYFAGLPATEEELFEGSTMTISAAWVQTYELPYVYRTGDRLTISADALQYLYSGASQIPVARTGNVISVNPNTLIDRTQLSNQQVFATYSGIDRWLYQNPNEYLPAVASRYAQVYDDSVAQNLVWRVKCEDGFADAVRACTDCDDVISALSSHDVGRTFYVRLARPIPGTTNFQLSREVKVLAIDASHNLTAHAQQAFQDFGGRISARWRMEISNRLQRLATWDRSGPIGVVFRTAP